MDSRSKGFTLVELMIGVAIVGLLAVIAMPAYQDYIIKSQVNRVVGELSAYKVVVEERFSHSGSITNADIGYVASSLVSGAAGSDIAAFNADGTGQIQVTVGGNAHKKLAGLIVRFERTADGIWSCVIDNTAVAVTWKLEYLTPGCRL